MLISLIAAVADNGVIGTETGLPWHLPSDLKRFRALTWEKPILMGRKTAALLGRPLPQRLNIVLTRSDEFAAEGFAVAHSVADALDLARQYLEKQGGEELVVIGGEDVYRQFLNRCERLYLTRVDGVFPGTVRFPLEECSRLSWNLVRKEVLEADAKNSQRQTFFELHRSPDTASSSAVAEAFGPCHA